MQDPPEISVTPQVDEAIANAEKDPARKIKIIELLVFLLLFLPSMMTSFYLPSEGYLTFRTLSVRSIVADFSLICLICYFLWRNGESTACLGWSFKGRLGDGVIGFLLFFPFFISLGIFGSALHKIGAPMPPTSLPTYLIPKSIAECGIAALLVIVIAISEETMFRGYIMLRIGSFTSKSWAILVMQALFFSLMHGYQGAMRMVMIFYMGLCLGLVYQWRKSLVAPIMIHLLQDFIPLVIIPLYNLRHGHLLMP